MFGSHLVHLGEITLRFKLPAHPNGLDQLVVPKSPNKIWKNRCVKKGGGGVGEGLSALYLVSVSEQPFRMLRGRDV